MTSRTRAALLFSSVLLVAVLRTSAEVAEAAAEAAEDCGAEDCAAPARGMAALQHRRTRGDLQGFEGEEGGLRGFEGEVANRTLQLVSGCTWESFGSRVPHDEGKEIGSVSGSSSSCRSKCDQTAGCTAFARCGSSCYMKGKRFQGSESTKSNRHCTFQYRRCPLPTEPGCYIITSGGVFKLLGQEQPGWDRAHCTRSAGSQEAVFVPDPAAPKPKGVQIRFADQNIMSWRTWCSTDNWKHIVDRIKNHNADIVGWQEMGDNACTDANSGWTKHGRNHGKFIYKDVANRLGMAYKRYNRLLITYKADKFEHLYEKRDGSFNYARFRHKETGATFWFFSVHTGGSPQGWCHDMDELNRVVRDLRRQNPNDGFVHVGDYNTWGDLGFENGGGTKYLKGHNDCWGKPKLSQDVAWKDATEGEGQTYCDYRNCQSSMKIDHIFYSKEFERKWSKSFQPVREQYDDKGRYSDHTLLLADLYLENTA